MPRQTRHGTKYQGVYYLVGTDPRNGKPEKIFYIRYRRDGKRVEEKAGRQHVDKMTAAKAAKLRAARMSGEPTNQERREAAAAKAAAEAGRWTINRLWDEYKRRRPGLKGIVTDQNRFDNHLAPSLGDKEPGELVPLDVDRIRLKLLKTHAPATVRNVLELLRRIINFGAAKNLCQGLAFKIEMPAVDNVKTEDLTGDQLRALWDAIEADHNVQVANLMKLALLSGMRRGELFRLQWADIDYQRGFITIRGPKGGKAQKIPLSKSAAKLLREHPRVEGSEFVFPGREGRQRVDAKKQLNRIKARAGLPADFRALHGLRHVYASTLASSGRVDMYTLQKLLTHKSPQMTMRYAHLRDEALKNASVVADEILSKVTAQPRKKVLKASRPKKG